MDFCGINSAKIRIFAESNIPLMIERQLKLQISYQREFTNIWFWRTTQQKEIDLIEETDGQLSAIEMKWNVAKAKTKAPLNFTSSYPDALFKVITPENVFEYLL